MVELEQKYKMNVIISADDSIKNIADYRIERIKAVKIQSEEKKAADEGLAEQRQVQAAAEETAETGAEVQTAETESENNVRRSRRERSGRNRESAAAATARPEAGATAMPRLRRTIRLPPEKPRRQKKKNKNR